MKRSSSRITATCLAAALLFSTTLVRADEDDKTPLSEQMSGIAKDMRALRKQLKDPAQKDSSVKLVKDMEEHAAKARTLEPAKTKTVAPGEREKFLADFRKQIDGLIGDLQKLEGQVAAGKLDEANATLEELQNVKRDGHKKFINKKS